MTVKALLSFALLCTVINISLAMHKTMLNEEGVIIYSKMTNQIPTDDNEGQNFSKAISVILRKSFQEIADFVRTITNKIAEFPDDNEKSFNNLTKNLMIGLEKLRKKLLDSSDAFVQDLFSHIRNQLEQVKNEFLNLAENMDQQFDLAVTHFNESLMNYSMSIDDWAAEVKDELRTFDNNTIYLNACNTIDSFMEESTERLRSCCQIAIKPINSLCRRTRMIFGDALRLLADDLDRIQICLDDKRSYLEYMIPCVSLIYDEISDVLTRAEQILKQFSSILPVKILYSDWCFVIVMENMEQRKMEISKQFINKN